MRKFLFLTTAVLSILFVWLLVFYLSAPAGWLLSLLITCGTMLYHFAMRLAVGHLLPQRFTGKGKWFQQKNWEPKLYETLKVQAWKRFMPTYASGLFDLSKHSLDAIIAAMCHAELVHEVIILLSFLPLFAALLFGDFLIFLFTSFFAASVDALFVIMQRYNRPRLMALNARREERARRQKTEE